MKKTILFLTFALGSICGFSQTFSYELIGQPTQNGQPYPSSLHPNDSLCWSTSVVVGIVGEPHGFTQANSFICTFPSSGLDAKEIIAYIYAASVAFVKETYPTVKVK